MDDVFTLLGENSVPRTVKPLALNMFPTNLRHVWTGGPDVEVMTLETPSYSSSNCAYLERPRPALGTSKIEKKEYIQ